MKINIPFGDTELTLTGDYYPARPGKMYLSNGDAGYPDEPSTFDISEIFLNNENVTDEMSNMYVKKPNGGYELWLDTMLDKILEEADNVYCAARECS